MSGGLIDKVYTGLDHAQAAFDIKSRILGPRPKANIPNVVPQPKLVSTTSTPLTNDPLWKDSFDLDGEAGVFIEEATKDFSPDAAGFISLVEQEYSAISDVDKFYTKSVPASAHTYYHVVMYWYKLALVEQKHGTASPEHVRLVHFVNGYSPVVGSGAGAYLAGLGDFQDATGVKHILSHDLPNRDGHYGRINAESHKLYETLPAPAIVLQRVLADIASSGRRGFDPTWRIQGIEPVAPRQAQPPPPKERPPPRSRQRPDLEEDEEVEGAEGPADEGPADEGPADEGPADEGSADEGPVNRPTVNLLGWRPACPLGKNQISKMQAIFKGDEEDFNEVETVIPNYALNRGLFEFVHNRLRECKRYKVVPMPINTSGSIAQQLIWEPMLELTDPHTQFVDGEGRIKSRTMLPTQFFTAACIMAYKSLRREVEGEDGEPVNNWACYHFGHYANVPQNWRNNRNFLLARGFQGLLTTPFKGPVTSRRDLMTKFFNKNKQA